MGLKTPESRLRELGLGDYAIVYDDDECMLESNPPDTAAIAWLYSAHNGSIEYGHWTATLDFIAKGPTLLPLAGLTEVLKEIRR